MRRRHATKHENGARSHCIAHFAARRFTVDHRRRERYSKEFRQQAVERMNACDNIARLSRELGVARHLLYHWRERLEHEHAPVGRSRELILRKQILALKRMLA